jgi:PAS domain S-box-containing protein
MDDRLIASSPQNYINEFFWKSPNSMAISQARDGKYIEINEALEKTMGLSRQDVIGQTSVGIGHITAQQRLVLLNEIKKSGCAQNIELEVKVKNNEVKCGLFNSYLIKTEKDDLWLTIVTNISERRLAAEARQDNIIFKSLAALEGTGVILIRGYRRQQPYSFFINEEASRALGRRPITDLLDAIEGHESTYFTTKKGCYHVKTISIQHGSSRKIILLELLPDAVCVKEELRQYNLTRRQEEIALFAAMGHSNKEIAGKFFITEYTVKDHLKEIFQRVGVCRRSELCSKILKWR